MVPARVAKRGARTVVETIGMTVVREGRSPECIVTSARWLPNREHGRSAVDRTDRFKLINIALSRLFCQDRRDEGWRTG